MKSACLSSQQRQNLTHPDFPDQPTPSPGQRNLNTYALKPYKPLDLTIFQHIPFLPPSFFLPCQVFSCCILTLRIFHPQMTAMNKDGGRSCRRGIKTTSSVELRLQYRSLSLTRNKIKNASAPVSNDTLPHSPSLHLREAPKSILRWCYFPVASMGLEVEARTQFCSAFF